MHATRIATARRSKQILRTQKPRAKDDIFSLIPARPNTHTVTVELLYPRRFRFRIGVPPHCRLRANLRGLILNCCRSPHSSLSPQPALVA